MTEVLTHYGVGTWVLCGKRKRDSSLSTEPDEVTCKKCIEILQDDTHIGEALS